MFANMAMTALEDLQDIEANLVALAPLVVLVSSLVLSPEASARVKRLVPTVISVLSVVGTFAVTEFPDGDTAMVVANVLTNIAVVTGLAVALYEPMSAVLAPGDRGLNEVTGPGLVGRSGPDQAA